MKRWEYRQTDIYGEYERQLIEELNELGQEGWEVIQYQSKSEYSHGRSSARAIVLLKRPSYITNEEKVADVLEQIEEEK